MKPIQLITLTNGDAAGPALEVLERLAAGLAHVFQTTCQIRPSVFNISFALDAGRNQYYSTAILQRLERQYDLDSRILGVTWCDLFVPVLTFVFGEAQLDGNCATVSMARLREEAYGLPAREELLRDRLLKQAVHELGHTFGLRHCADWRCVMTSSHAVERVDVKSAEFCAACRKAVFPAGRTRAASGSPK